MDFRLFLEFFWGASFAPHQRAATGGNVMDQGPECLFGLVECCVIEKKLAPFAQRLRVVRAFSDRPIECIARAREVCLRLCRPAFHQQALDAAVQRRSEARSQGIPHPQTCALAAPSRPARAILVGTAAPRAPPRAIAARPLE
jgi:hypothetical protein